MTSARLNIFKLTLLFLDGRSYSFNSSGTTGLTPGSSDISLGFLEVESLSFTRTIESGEYSFKLPLASENELYPVDINSCFQSLDNPIELEGVKLRFSQIVNSVEKVLFYGSIIKVSFTNSDVTITATDYCSRFGYGRTFQISNSCRWAFNSDGCGLTRTYANYTTFDVAADRLSLTINPTPTMPVQEYKDGFLTIQNFVCDIAYNNQTQVFMWEELPYYIVPGSVISLSKGCNKSYTQCLAYGNSPNFGGFPSSIPGMLPGTQAFISGKKDLR